MPLLELENVTKHFPVFGGVFRRMVGKVHAVTEVSFSLEKGETLGLVGESGSGKSTLGRSILRLSDPISGSIRFEGKDLVSMGARELKHTRQHMQMIFQDPFSSVDPRMTVGSIVEEPLRIHGIGNNETRREKAAELLEKVGIQPESIRQYPHEFSGGQRQRIGIARAIALKPKLIIADEPVSALDVSIQSQILNLLKEIREEMNLACIFIAHNMAVVKHISDRIAVMYAGRIVELGESESVCQDPRHPYTKALISSIPVPRPGKKNKKQILQGDVPSPLNPPRGCAFHLRCPHVEEICKREIPPLNENKVHPEKPHWVACHLQ
ncbi:MAG: ATP-binding cassette domain-containing protein [SAR324 cluster bacterium]|nr:ATP-binding cassette domain-containing protein [SAR324 cluster bacterium]